MKLVTIQRGPSTPDGIHGSMMCDGELICYTLERPWDFNRKDTSCIEPGNFTVMKHNSDKFPDVWELLDVEGREGILIHAGNTIKDTHGCILVGLGIMTGGITQSQAALKKLRGLFPGAFMLEIRNA